MGVGEQGHWKNVLKRKRKLMDRLGVAMGGVINLPPHPPVLGGIYNPLTAVEVEGG